MHTLLLGNGLNRLSLAVNWIELLTRLAAEFSVAHLVQQMEQKPLSMLFEELCAHCGGQTFRGAELLVKKKIASLVCDIEVHELHKEYANLFDIILTTNYDDTLERSISAPIVERAPIFPESRYSLFRRYRVADKEVWRIHGDSARPDSIVLGYDHYAGYLQKIRNYLTDGLRVGNAAELIRSPLKAGAQDFERWQWHHSWVDHFLRNHLHIVGLGLDFTEIDLWWLLLHKRRRRNITGHTFYYRVSVQGQPSPLSPQLSVLRSLGVDVYDVPAPTYREGYALILELVAANVKKHPMLLESARSSRSTGWTSADSSIDPEPLPDVQLKLPLRKAKRRSSR